MKPKVTTLRPSGLRPLHRLAGRTRQVLAAKAQRNKCSVTEAQLDLLCADFGRRLERVRTNRDRLLALCHELEERCGILHPELTAITGRRIAEATQPLRVLRVDEEGQ